MVKGDSPNTNSKAQKKKTMKTYKTSNQNKPVKTGNSGLQNRSEQLGSETQKPDKRIPIDFDLRRQNRTLSTEKVLNLLQQEAPRFYELAEVVGKWIWIQFTEKQPREITAVLAQLGFHWNNTRQVWQHPCGEALKEAASYDPRERYGSRFPADTKAA